MKKTIFILSFFIAYSSTCLGAVINNFDVALTVSQNGELIVREIITVTTEGNQIKRGIIRDIPTHYKTSEGLNFNIGFNLISVKKEGVDTPYKIFSKRNGISIRIGQRNVLLPPGQYRYEINYSVNRAIGFFQNHDELYWNVTGNGWKFPIEHATAEVFLPTGADIAKIIAYTGSQGQTGKNYRQKTPLSNQAVIETTKPLPAFQGLTIAIAWPKGIITEPTITDKLNWLITDNTSLVFLAIMLLIIIIFYLLCWSQLGKDNLNQAAFPRYHPPKGFSPQALAYIKNMRYDDSLFSTAIIQMAVKGFISISKKNTKYHLTKNSNFNPDNNKEKSLTKPEQSIANELFASSESFTVKKSNHETLSQAITAFKKALKNEFQQRYFITNAAIVILGSLLSMIAVIPYLYSNGETAIAMIILAVTSYLVTDFLFKTKPGQWIKFKNLSSVISIAVAILILVQFISWQALNSHLLGFSLVAMLAIVNASFVHLLRRPTALGKKVILQAEGFELFLKASEQDQLEFRNPPQKTPQLFERYLPYALALGLGQAWSSQFSKILLSKQYQPQWYNGSMSDFTPDTFSTNLSDSLTSSISSSSVAPGSSSGFSGGSSGGGGGGGGGGGW